MAKTKATYFDAVCFSSIGLYSSRPLEIGISFLFGPQLNHVLSSRHSSYERRTSLWPAWNYVNLSASLWRDYGFRPLTRHLISRSEFSFSSNCRTRVPPATHCFSSHYNINIKFGSDLQTVNHAYRVIKKTVVCNTKYNWRRMKFARLYCCTAVTLFHHSAELISVRSSHKIVQ